MRRKMDLNNRKIKRREERKKRPQNQSPTRGDNIEQRVLYKESTSYTTLLPPHPPPTSVT